MRGVGPIVIGDGLAAPIAALPPGISLVALLSPGWVAQLGPTSVAASPTRECHE